MNQRTDIHLQFLSEKRASQLNMENLTYSKYTTEYGGLADEVYFNKTRPEAEAFIRQKTMGKVDKQLTPELLDMVLRAVGIYIDTSFSFYGEYKDRLTQSAKGIKSESVLSHSVTYEGVDFEKYEKEKGSKARKVVLEYLLPSGLLNSSVRYTNV